MTLLPQLHGLGLELHTNILLTLSAVYKINTLLIFCVQCA